MEIMITKTFTVYMLCTGDMRHQPKTAKIILGMNYHVLNSRVPLTRLAVRKGNPAVYGY